MTTRSLYLRALLATPAWIRRANEALCRAFGHLRGVVHDPQARLSWAQCARCTTRLP